MAIIDSVKLPDNSTYDVADNYSGYGEEIDAIVNVYGAKNTLNVTASTTTINGITLTVNSDKSITIGNGTANANIDFRLETDNTFYLPKAQVTPRSGFILSSGVQNDHDFYLYMFYADDAQGSNPQAVLTNFGDVIVPDAPYYASVNIFIRSGYSFSTPITIKPMIRDPRIVDPTYQPHAETNQQLTNRISGLSNENLLYNPFFTVNSRGQSSYPATGYCLDLWYFANAGNVGTISKGPNGISFTKGGSGWQYSELLEWLDPSLISFLEGKTVTASVLLNGSVYSTTFTYGVDHVAMLTDAIQFFCISGVYFEKSFLLRFHDDVHYIRAVKFELGSISTLANDILPDYALELAKCQTSTQGQLITSAIQGIVGSKNLCPPIPSGVNANVTFTTNADGSVTVNSTPNWDYAYRGIEITNYVKAGQTYKITGGHNVGKHIVLSAMRSDYSFVRDLCVDYGDGVLFTPDFSDYQRINFNIIITQGQTCTNEVFYPMLRLASDTDETYEPFAMTNKMLTDAVYKKFIPVENISFTAYADGVKTLSTLVDDVMTQLQLWINNNPSLAFQLDFMFLQGVSARPTDNMIRDAITIVGFTQVGVGLPNFYMRYIVAQSSGSQIYLANGTFTATDESSAIAGDNVVLYIIAFEKT